jgi:hemoglobin
VVETNVRLSGAPSLYDHVGGMPFFERLVAAFYRGVAADPVLLSLYPDQVDLGPAQERLTLFLAQYWGGPTTYSEARGHPRLRMRHAPFAIAERERDAWLAAMNRAIDEVDPGPEVAAAFHQYFDMAADAMRNT